MIRKYNQKLNVKQPTTYTKLFTVVLCLLLAVPYKKATARSFYYWISHGYTHRYAQCSGYPTEEKFISTESVSKFVINSVFINKNEWV